MKNKINFWGRIHHFLFFFDLVLLTLILLFPMIVAEKFIKPARRGYFWRKKVVWIVKTTLNLNGIKIKVKNKPDLDDGISFIYAANHPSNFDGFILLTILGPKNILLTAPLQQFPKLLATWMKKMESVQVRGDAIDDASYPQSESKQHAIQHAIKALKNGDSLIILHDGHIELVHLIHYFHTGCARISVGSNTPVVPIALHNVDHVFPDEKHVIPGTVTVTLGTPLKKTQTDIKKIHTEFTKSKILSTRHKIEKAIIDMLPLRYQPAYWKQSKNKKIGVFIDIDRTMHEGFPRENFVKYLFSLHNLHYNDAMIFFYWLFLEKAGKLPHKKLMKESLCILNGWDIGELRNVVQNPFHNKIIKNKQYGFFPILKDHAEAKHSIIFISEIIHPLAQEFKHLFAGRTTLDTKLAQKYRCYSGKTNCLCYKDTKARLLEEFAHRANIDLKKSYAYADGFSDIPFMNLVGHPTAINPDPDLYEYARIHKFNILENIS